MTVLDLVELNEEKEEYIKLGLHKGARGWLWNKKHKGGAWLIKFPIFKDGQDFLEIYVKDDDLRLISTWEWVI